MTTTDQAHVTNSRHPRHGNRPFLGVLGLILAALGLLGSAHGQTAIKAGDTITLKAPRGYLSWYEGNWVVIKNVATPTAAQQWTVESLQDAGNVQVIKLANGKFGRLDGDADNSVVLDGTDHSHWIPLGPFQTGAQITLRNLDWGSAYGLTDRGDTDASWDVVLRNSGNTSFTIALVDNSSSVGPFAQQPFVLKNGRGEYLTLLNTASVYKPRIDAQAKTYEAVPLRFVPREGRVGIRVGDTKRFTADFASRDSLAAQADSPDCYFEALDPGDEGFDWVLENVDAPGADLASGQRIRVKNVYYDQYLTHQSDGLTSVDESPAGGNDIWTIQAYETEPEPVLPEALQGDVAVNGVPGLGQLTLDQVVLPGTHNSGAGYRGDLYYWEDVVTAAPAYKNQGLSFTGQLDAGVRYLDVDTMWVPFDDYDGEWWGGANGGGAWTGHAGAYAGPVQDILDQVGAWMRLPRNRNEVVVLHFNNNWRDDPDVIDDQNLIGRDISERLQSTVGDLVAALRNEAGDSNTDTWPSLASAIKTNRRLFVFMNEAFEPSLSDWAERHVFSETGADILDAYTGEIGDAGRGAEAVLLKNARMCDGAVQPFVRLSLFPKFPISPFSAPYYWETCRIADAGRSRVDRVVNFLLADLVGDGGEGQGHNNIVTIARRLNTKRLMRLMEPADQIQPGTWRDSNGDDIVVTVNGNVVSAVPTSPAVRKWWDQGTGTFANGQIPRMEHKHGETLRDVQAGTVGDRGTYIRWANGSSWRRLTSASN